MKLLIKPYRSLVKLFFTRTKLGIYLYQLKLNELDLSLSNFKLKEEYSYLHLVVDNYKTLTLAELRFTMNALQDKYYHVYQIRQLIKSLAIIGDLQPAQLMADVNLKNYETNVLSILVDVDKAISETPNSFLMYRDKSDAL